MPLIAIGVMAFIGSSALQRALLHSAGVTSSLVLVVVYVQALAGESIVSPSVATLWGLAVAVAAGFLTAMAVLSTERGLPRDKTT